MALPEFTSTQNTLEAGLHVVATPIGNAQDITLRALDVLRQADLLLAEDTRRLRQLMQIHAVPLGGRPIWAYHDRNGGDMRPKVLEKLRAGLRVALASDAGTPLIADPGYKLVAEARHEGLAVSAAPGVSALTTALSIAGLASDRVLFAGFLASARTQRRKALQELAGVPATLAIFESPHRIRDLLADACTILGEERPAALCRELTKKFEEVTLSSLGDLHAANFLEKGEIVLLIERPSSHNVRPSQDDVERRLVAALATQSLRDAVDQVTADTGMRRRDVYQIGLSLSRSEPKGDV